MLLRKEGGDVKGLPGKIITQKWGSYGADNKAIMTADGIKHPEPLVA